jgi:hypothetical protein
LHHVKSADDVANEKAFADFKNNAGVIETTWRSTATVLGAMPVANSAVAASSTEKRGVVIFRGAGSGLAETISLMTAAAMRHIAPLA